MTRGKWMLLLALLMGTLLLVGCSSKEEEKNPAPDTEQTQKDPAKEEPKAEEPKAEAPKAEEPKAEEPKAEEPKAEAPKAETPKAETPKAEAPKADAPKASAVPALNLAHELRDNCAMCHSGGAMLAKKPNHAIDGNTGDCKSCHTLNAK